MPTLKIENERVRKNIELFLHILSRVPQQEQIPLHQRVYKACINRVNGEVVFLDLVPEPNQLDDKEWKNVLIRCEPSDGKLNFDVLETEGDAKSFHCEELAPLAYETVAETIHQLNAVAQLFQREEDFEVQLDALSHLSIEPSSVRAPFDLIHTTWHALNRFQAETLLLKHPYGSFFFRKDEYAIELEKMLMLAHGCPIKCFTLTFSEPEKKVCDLTVVFKEDRCLVYNDDPNLSGQFFPSLQALLSSYREKCKYPIFH